MCYSFFFVKQKTAYEMRISDWSSDVCSSDLNEPVPHDQRPALPEGHDAVVTADQPRTLGDKQRATRHAIISIFGDLRGYDPREIGVEPSDQAGSNHAAGLEHPGGHGR